jgi:hypothetical protein
MDDRQDGRRDTALFIKKFDGEKHDSDGSAAGNWLQTDWKTVLNTCSPAVQRISLIQMKLDYTTELLQIIA